MKETTDQEPMEEINTDDPHPTKLWKIKKNHKKMHKKSEIQTKNEFWVEGAILVKNHDIFV